MPSGYLIKVMPQKYLKLDLKKINRKLKEINEKIGIACQNMVKHVWLKQHLGSF